jgi:hypothetical protein
MKREPYLSPSAEINEKCIKDLQLRPETVKETRKMLPSLAWNMTPDSKPKTARWDYIKLKASVQQSSE